LDERAKRTLIIAIVSAVAILALLALLGYLLWPRPTAAATLRDFAIIILALESIVVLFLLGVVIGLLWWLIQTVERKIIPILDSTSETVNTVRGTATFVSDTVVSPLIRAASYAAAIRRAAQVLAGWREGGAEEGPEEGQSR